METKQKYSGWDRTLRRSWGTHERIGRGRFCQDLRRFLAQHVYRHRSGVEVEVTASASAPTKRQSPGLQLFGMRSFCPDARIAALHADWIHTHQASHQG